MNRLLATTLAALSTVAMCSTAPVAEAQRVKASEDSTVLAVVGPRVVRVMDFNELFFDSDPEHRPRPDSAGRVEFLRSIVNKNVMGLTALELNQPLDFEDRAVLREHTNRTVSNVLYQRMVIDSIPVGDEDIARAYEQFKYEYRLRHIQIPDRATAERVLRDLRARRITWPVAVRQYSTAASKDKDGDMGWRARLGVDSFLGFSVFTLQPGEFSEVLSDPNGYQIIQVAERRPGSPPALEPMRRMIKDQIISYQAGQRGRNIQIQLLSGLDLVYDEANVEFAASTFQRTVSLNSEDGGPTLQIDPNLPEFTASDRERVLARYRGGQVTLADLIAAYEKIPPMLRPAMDNPEAVHIQIDGVVLEPRMIELAFERGIDKDPLAAKYIDEKREQLLVENLYRDSIESQVRVTDAQRRKFYEDNKPGFITFPRVRFAAISRHSAAGADSLKARLLAGEDAAAILQADSLAGQVTGSIQERQQNDHGPMHKVLFEELRPGKVHVEGPDKKGDYAVIQLLSFDPGRQLSYTEAIAIVDEAVRSRETERLLQDFIARNAKRFEVRTYPERVMGFDLETL